MNSKQHIQYFPSGVLNKIFSYIDEEDMCNHVPFVCEKWKLAASKRLQMKNAVFEGKSVTAKEVCFVLFNAPQLESVTLLACKDAVPILRQICRCNTALKKLILRDCSSDGEMIPEEVFINVLLTLPELKILELYNTKFRSNLFYELVAMQTNITCIDLSLNEFVTVDNLMKLVHNSRISEFKLSRRLREPEITDEEMSHLIRTMSHRLALLHLDMGGIGGSAYNDILNCTRLVDLMLNNAMNLSIDVLKRFPQQLRKVKHLSLEGPTQGLSKGDVYNSLFSGTGFGNQLESLKLEKCDSLDDQECCDVIKSCPHLTVLSLKGCKYLTFQGIESSINKANQLQYLNIAFLGKLPNVIDVKELSQLRELVIDKMSSNSSEIFQSNSELKVIKVI